MRAPKFLRQGARLAPIRMNFSFTPGTIVGLSLRQQQGLAESSEIYCAVFEINFLDCQPIGPTISIFMRISKMLSAIRADVNEISSKVVNPDEKFSAIGRRTDVNFEHSCEKLFPCVLVFFVILLLCEYPRCIT